MLLHIYFSCNQPLAAIARYGFAVILGCGFLAGHAQERPPSHDTAGAEQQDRLEQPEGSEKHDLPVPWINQMIPEGTGVAVQTSQIEDSELVIITAAIRIQAPRTVVWDVLIDCDYALDYVPNIRECTVLQSGIDAQGIPFDVTRHRLKPYFFLPSVNSQFRATYRHPRQIDFRREGGDLMAFSGSWHFRSESDAGTLLSYTATVDLHQRIGQRREQQILMRDMPNLLRRLRTLAEGVYAEQLSQAEQTEISDMPQDL